MEIIKNGIIDSLKKRFYYVLNDDLNDYFIISTYLDFNYRKFTYLNDEEKSKLFIKRAQDTIEKYFSRYIKPSPSEQSEAQINVTNLQNITISSSTPIQTQIPSDQSVRKVRRDLSETEFLSTISDEQPITPILSTNDLKDEFKTYEFLSFNSMHNKRIYKLLEFYRQYKQEIPKIAKVAELIYCATASSVPSETLFSYAGIVQDEQRNRIEPSALNMVNFILINT